MLLSIVLMHKGKHSYYFLDIYLIRGLLGYGTIACLSLSKATFSCFL